MFSLRKFFATKKGIISVGVFIGVFAPLLQKWGNPGNMGVCVACFQRDIAGAVGLHRAIYAAGDCRVCPRRSDRSVPF